MARLLIVRHAQSVWNAAGRWQGWSDAPLSELGMEQARLAGESLAAAGLKPAVVACSDLARARLTAEIIAGQLGVRALVVDPALREHDVGDWNGLLHAEIVSRWPSEMEAWRAQRLDAFPGGERLGVFTERVRGALQRLGALALDADVVAVAHGGVVRAVEEWLGVWRQDNRHSNLSGWWVEATGTPSGVALVALGPVDLLAFDAEAVTDPL